MIENRAFSRVQATESRVEKETLRKTRATMGRSQSLRLGEFFAARTQATYVIQRYQRPDPGTYAGQELVSCITSVCLWIE